MFFIMKIKKENLSLYAVTDSRWTSKDYTLAMQVENAICGGVTCVQLREKNWMRKAFIRKL